MRDQNGKTSTQYSTKRSTCLLSIGLVSGLLISYGWASMPAPTEHKGLTVEGLGAIPEESISAQLELDGHKLQLRAITIEPGGQIAKHSHETRPGLVKVVSGTWTEGRPDGEREFSSDDAALLEDKDTVHWIYNRGDEPATAYVCDIVPQE